MEDHVLIQRQRHAQTTLDKWRDTSFKLGERDCVRMVADHLRRNGYRVKLPAKGSYSTALSATRKLRELGFETVAGAVGALGFEVITPASAITGDIIELPGEYDDGRESPLSALCIALGNGRALGFYDGVGCVVLQPLEYKSAWRVVPQ
jgi:hypothetical protein